MKKLTTVSIISILCMMAILVVAEEATTPDDAGGKTYTHVPFSLSFIPNISIGGLMGGDIITNCSINIIAGRYAKLRGVEFGSVLNWETEEVFGAQFSGVANFLENGDLTGLQAGVINYVGDDTRGVQWGVVNYIGDEALGVQSGVVNYIGDDTRGVQ